MWEEINEAVIQQQHRVCYLFFSLFLRLPLCVCYVTSHGRSGEGIYSTASTRAVTTQRERGGLDAFQCSAVGTHSHAHAIFPCHTYSRVGIRFFFFLIFAAAAVVQEEKYPKFGRADRMVPLLVAIRLDRDSSYFYLSMCVCVYFPAVVFFLLFDQKQQQHFLENFTI